jgi:hypothetical protein
MRFLQRQTVNLKKNATELGFAHAYCIHTQHHLSDTRWKRRSSGKKRQRQGSPKEIQTFHQDSFYRHQGSENSIKVVSRVASELEICDIYHAVCDRVVKKAKG